jgi:large subunit ribosomal protein L23
MSLFNIFDKDKGEEKYAAKSRAEATKAKTLKSDDDSKKTKATAIKESLSAAKAAQVGKSAALVLVAPHITEKSVYLSNDVKRGDHIGGQYVFKVSDRSTKPMIKRAVEEVYTVKVEDVKIIAQRDKTKWSRGRWGTKRGFKKALVILKKGDKIEFV